MLREPVQSFITPQLRFHPIERTLLCQSSAQRLRGFATMRCGVLELVIEFFVGDVDVLGGSDAVDNQFRFNIIGSPLLLPPSQRHPISVYASPAHPLPAPRA